MIWRETGDTVFRAGNPLAMLAALFVLLAPLVGCNEATTGGTATTDPLAPAQYGGDYSGGVATGDTEAGAQFARWVLDQDPQRQYITDAVVRNEQTLGVKINPQTTRGEVQQLLVSLTEGMARTFPGKPLKVIAFYQTGEKLAEANYDNTTGQVSFQ